MKENGRNLCKEKGCKGMCCLNTSMILSAKELKRVFPDAIRIKPDEDFPEIFGVYAQISSKNKFDVLINGPCPNLSRNADCNIYLNLPRPCDGVKIDSDECIKAKERFSMEKSDKIE